MKFLAVGDSFTFGEELSDVTDNITSSKFAWPELLGNQLGWEVTNLAKPGSGNTRMVRHCVEQVNNYDVAIIAWSHFARIEMADEAGFYDLWPGGGHLPHRGWADWRWEIIEYFTKHHNDDYLYRQYLLNIILIQNFFKANNKRYLMLDSFGNHQVNNRTADTNRDLLDQINGRFYVGWPNESMMEWTYGAEIGLHGHFLEQGHVKIAEKIYAFMDDLPWLL
jgi:hypothetical protein